MLAVVAVALLGAAEGEREVAVLLTSERRVSTDLISAVLAQTTDALAAEHIESVAGFSLSERLQGVGGPDAARRCQGSVPCVAKIAEGFGGVVVSVDVGKLGKMLTVQLDAVGPDGKVLVSGSASVPLRPVSLQGPLATFAASLAQVLPGRVVVKSEPKLVPTEPALPLLPPPQARASSGSKVPWVLAGVAAVGVVVSIVFAVLAGTGRQSWDRNLIEGGTGTMLTPSQAASLSRSINTNTSVAVGSGAGAVAFGLAALVTALVW